MEKIYTYPRNMIYAIMAELCANHEFELKETTWKPTRVDEIVCFEIRQKIKDLLESIFPTELNESYIVFNKKDNLWEAEVHANGVESYFFARMLFMALAKLRGGILNKHNVNCKIIEMYTIQAVVRNASNAPLGFVINATLEEDGSYKISFPINGSLLSFENKNVDQLCMGIVEHFKGRKKQ